MTGRTDATKTNSLGPERREINEYLFYEYGYDLEHDPSAVTPDWPFELHPVGTIRSQEGEVQVFEFSDEHGVNFALSGRTLTCYSAYQMTLDDLQIQVEGGEWIDRQGPIDLATSRVGYETIPPLSERRRATDELARTACESPRVHEGLYLEKRSIYLALIEDTDTGGAWVVGTGLEPHRVGFPQLPRPRRLALGVGQLLRR